MTLTENDNHAKCLIRNLTQIHARNHDKATRICKH